MMENYCSTIPQINVTNNSHLGRVASAILIMLDKWCICSNKPNKTKLYSFVYDLMRWAKFTGKTCITEEGFSGDIGREKCQQVRNWLKAWCIYSHATRKENVKKARNQVYDWFENMMDFVAKEKVYQKELEIRQSYAYRIGEFLLSPIKFVKKLLKK